jgi:hypothetical protein
MSAYHCEVCGHDGPLSEPCPVCEAAVRSALEGGYDVTKPQICVPMAETKGVLSRLEALRVEHAVLIEQLAQKNREIQDLGCRLDESRSWSNALETRIESWRSRYDAWVKCPRTCSECDGHHHRVEGSNRCKHCNAILPEEELDL